MCITSSNRFDTRAVMHPDQQMLAICEAAEVPSVFDAHHHVCFEQLDGMRFDGFSTSGCRRSEG